MLSVFFLIWRDALYYLHRASAYLVFFLPSYIGVTSKYSRKFSVSYTPICLTRLDEEMCDDLQNDIYRFQGEVIHKGKDDLWEPIAASHIFAEAMHRFIWLPHLALKGDTQAHNKMLALITDWVEHNSHWSQPAWRSDIVAQRLYYLLAYYENITNNMKDKGIERLNKQLCQHYHHLKTTAHWEMRGSKRLTAQIILLIAMLCKSESKQLVEKHMQYLIYELNQQIFPDGGHIERNPETHFVILRWLCILYDLFERDQRNLPEQISDTIDRMVPFLRMMQRQDGELFIFNGGGTLNHEEIEDLLPLAARGRVPSPLKSAPYSGFETLSNRLVHLMLDVGSFPYNPAGYHMHAGLLSMEVTMHQKPVFVNCGRLDHHADPYWVTAQRGSMAHSTVILDNYNSSSLRRYAIRRAKASVKRREEAGHLLLQTMHDGYLHPCRTIIERSLYLSEGDNRLVGEDLLRAGEEHIFHIRFHLHHRVVVELQDDKVFLRVDNAFICQFIYEGADLRIEDSIYSPNHDQLYQNKQLVLHGKNFSQNTVIRWSLKYLSQM